jgi:ureidoacrylate peracid hydrolase
VSDDDALLTTLAQKAAPGNAALVVVDVQNDFVADGGFFAKIGADMATIQRAVPPLLRLIECARKAGVPVVFVQAIYDQQYRSAPMRERDRRRTIDIPRCETGTWGADFYGVRPLPGEPVVIKHRYSGVINTELDPVLKRHGVKSLLLTGVATDTCVESTARDAYFIDYYVTLVSDCCAAFNAADHQGALARFERDYGPVVGSAEIIAGWERIGATRPVAARAAG